MLVAKFPNDPLCDHAELDLLWDSMAEYPELKFSIKSVRRAGATLSGPIWLRDERLDAEILQTFTIANSWRDSHIFPMRSIRISLRHKMRRAKIDGETVARTKRMESIRRKLREGTTKLDQMNDLGGCRAIMNDGRSVKSLIAAIRDDFRHPIRREYPYIDEPKIDGYRSHHIVFDFNGQDRCEVFHGRRIELQIRTRLQHCWATAVEAVELYRDEDLKHGRGSPDWLRLFALVSAEFAFIEECAIHPTMPERSERLKEIRDLNRRLNAVEYLENIKNATHFAENYVYDRGRYFLIRYTPEHQVTVETFEQPLLFTTRLKGLEEAIEQGNGEKVVVVEVDRIEKLVEMYPNYFGDVSLFVRNLRQICDGKRAIEYSMAPQQLVAPKIFEKPDPALLRRRYTIWNSPSR